MLRISLGTCSNATSRRSSGRTATVRRGRHISTKPTTWPSGASATSGRHRGSTDRRSALRRHGLHLAQRREASERFQLDLSDALAGEPEATADLLERLRLRVVEAVAKNE